MSKRQLNVSSEEVSENSNSKKNYKVRCTYNLESDIPNTISEPLTKLATIYSTSIMNQIYANLNLKERIKLARSAKLFLKKSGFKSDFLSINPCNSPWNNWLYITNKPRQRTLVNSRVAYNDSLFFGLGDLPIKKLTFKYEDNFLMKISTMRLSCISHLSKLTHLDMSNCSFGHPDKLYVLKFLKSLEHLNLENCTNITNNALTHIKDLPLKYLNLHNCFRISDQGLLKLNKFKLTYLNLRECRRITNKGLEVVKNFHDLQHLNVGLCDNLTDEGIKLLLNHPLKILDLEYCHLITDKGIESIQNMHLKKVNLLGLDQLTSKTLTILNNMSLENIYLSYYESINENEMTILKQLPIKILDISFCANIQNYEKEIFLDRFLPPFEILFYSNKNLISTLEPQKRTITFNDYALGKYDKLEIVSDDLKKMKKSLQCMKRLENSLVPNHKIHKLKYEITVFEIILNKYQGYF